MFAVSSGNQRVSWTIGVRAEGLLADTRQKLVT